MDWGHILKSIKKEAQVGLSDLGPPGQDQIGPYADNMFISQEDSKIDEYTPQGNQNIGKFQLDVPKNVQKEEAPISYKKPSNTNQRMSQLTKLMESLNI